MTDVNDVARVVKEAFIIATTGRPGPVLIDMPKDVQQAKTVPDYDAPMNLPGFQHREPQGQARADQADRRGDQAGQAADHLRRRRHHQRRRQRRAAQARQEDRHPRHDDRDGPGRLPQRRSAVAGHARHARHRVRQLRREQADLLIALGVRFDDRVTGKVEEFCKHGKIVHVDIDASEINKNKPAHIPVCSDVKYALAELNKIVEAPEDISAWVEQCQKWKKEEPFHYNEDFAGILQQHAIRELWKLTHDRDPVITVGVGQHQMWAAQFYKFDQPRTCLSSSGLGTMGFGLPAAMGVQSQLIPDRLVIDIDGDGSFQMNIQELATCFCEKLPVKVLLLNNQHLGMVVQWEDRFMQGNRAHTYLGPIDHPEAARPGRRPRPERALSRLRRDRQGLRLRRRLHPQEGRPRAGARRR